jgi:hypothetical protein
MRYVSSIGGEDRMGRRAASAQAAALRSSPGDRRGVNVAYEALISAPAHRDSVIAEFMKAAERSPPSSWMGSSVVHREHAPAYLQYPAMMSPAVQRDLLRLLLEVAPESSSVIDPFCGSGTVLSEAMYEGLGCWASDINPLAVLVCRVKAGKYDAPLLARRFEQIQKMVRIDTSRAIETDLPNWRKWFRETALSRLRRAIRRLQDKASRRFFWTCLAETVRRTSNSRTSTYKLHIRPRNEIENVAWPSDVFKAVAEENIAKHGIVAKRLGELGRLAGKRYYGSLNVYLKNASERFPDIFDILMTSPPYGDNATTVPYGQSAYLPLHWIDLKDIDAKATPGLLKTTHEIDRRCLGGMRPRPRELKALAALRKRSPTLDRLLRKLADKPVDRRTRVMGFVRDLDEVLPKLLSAVRVNGYMAFTVGNRRVGGHEVRLADILTDLLCDRSAVLVARCTRRIPHKRMAIRNSISQTMRIEHLLVFRRVAAKPVSTHG